MGKITFHTLVSYAGRVVSSILGLLAIGVITRTLGQEGFGEYTTIVAYISMFVILGDLGLQVLMAREISQRKDGIGDMASAFFTLRFLSSLFFLLVGFALSFFFPYSAEMKLGILIGAVGFFFLSMNQLLLSIFQKHLAMHITAIAEIIGRGTQLLFVYLIYRIYAGDPVSRIVPWEIGSPASALYLFLAAMSGAALIIFILQYYFAIRYVKLRLAFNVKQWTEILKTTWPIALSIVLTMIYFKIDTIFLSVMKPQADVGIYGVAYRMLESLIFFPAMFAGIMMPILSREAVSDLKRFRDVFQRAFRIITIFAAPIVTGGIILAYSIAGLIGGKDFVAAGAPLQALFVATGIIFFGNLLGRAVIALDAQKQAVFAYLFGVALNVVLNLIFIPKYTYMGAAWTTVATEFIITVFLFLLIRRRVKISLEIATIIKTAFAAGVMGGVLFYLIPSLTSPVPLAELSLLIVTGGGIYFGVFYLISNAKILSD